MNRRYPTWIVRWNADKTVGVIWRMVDWHGLPPAPCIEGKCKRGAAVGAPVTPGEET